MCPVALGLTQSQCGMMLQEGPVLLVRAVGRLDQQVADLPGRGSSRNPQRLAVDVVSVDSDELKRSHLRLRENHSSNEHESKTQEDVSVSTK